MFTLNVVDRHAVFDARGNGDGKTVNTIAGDHGNRVTDYTALVMAVHQNQCGEVRAGEVANTLSTNGNASGRNAPLIAIGLDSEYNAYPELYGTLKAHMSGGSSETVAVAVDCRDGTEAEVNGALQTNGNSLNANVTVRQASVVRRLTPLECERLQGFPDGWTALEPVRDMTDEELAFWRREQLEKGIRERRVRKNEAGVYEVWRYLTPKSKGFDPKREKDEKDGYWMNTGKPYREMTKERMIRWYNGRFCADSDSARYRALGNSIALPPWKWVLKRISAQYERDATMGSLFDGIGGFPYLWEGFNGKGSTLWASEIEEFCIAVTRRRFS